MEMESVAPHHFGRSDRRATTSPTVSIVIVSYDPEGQLESRIASLRSRYDPAQTEFVLAWAGSGRTSTIGDLKRRFPHVRILSAAPSTSLADLRIQGIKAATGDIVLLLEHDSSAEADLTQFAIAERKADAQERSGTATWSVALGSAKERARVLSN